ncbi:hypothetical protein [Paraburkholderia solisilvae]|nr:hypothetical protein [Paraburkholderia solisilvae]
MLAGIVAVHALSVSAQNEPASTPAAHAVHEGSSDAIVRMRQQEAAANRVYQRKVAAAKKVYDEKKTEARKERDATIAHARYSATQ